MGRRVDEERGEGRSEYIGESESEVRAKVRCTFE